MDVRELERLRIYEKALERFERGEFVESLEMQVDLELTGTNDAALEYLLEQTKRRLKSWQPKIVPARSLKTPSDLGSCFSRPAALLIRCIDWIEIPDDLAQA
ncbi:MAG: hypothetical protein P8M80_16285, partial [Pirellulaceae bacterium]|nr:hypothetical protein [Pirellulaceae bacterium]